MTDGSPPPRWGPSSYSPFRTVGVYLSLRAHNTAATFDPAAEDGGGNALYQKIFAAIESNRARIQFQFAGRPPSDASIVMVYINDDLRSLTFPLDWTGSAAHLEVACTAEISWTIEYAGDVVGTITFAPGDQLDGDTRSIRHDQRARHRRHADREPGTPQDPRARRR